MALPHPAAHILSLGSSLRCLFSACITEGQGQGQTTGHDSWAEFHICRVLAVASAKSLALLGRLLNGPDGSSTGPAE